jgi:hypothetical protein
MPVKRWLAGSGVGVLAAFGAGVKPHTAGPDDRSPDLRLAPGRGLACAGVL